MRHLFVNQGFAEVYHALAAIKKGWGGEGIRITASHSDPQSLYRAAADTFIVEPHGLLGRHYAEWVHEQVAACGADLVWPQRRAAAILGLDFPASTTVIVAGDVPTLHLLADKVKTYRACTGTEIPVPAFRVVTTPAELREGLDAITASGEVPCVKPAVSTFGHGFRRVLDESDPFHRLLTNDTYNIGRAELLELYEQSEFRTPLLVMPFLEGPEYSIDCLARKGVLVRHVARRKTESRGQLLTTHAELERIAAAATAFFRLDAVFNVQLREHRGALYLLEINPRMSGGLGIASASGLSFPEWAVRLAIGEPVDDVPHPRYGDVVAQIECPVRLSAGEPPELTLGSTFS